MKRFLTEAALANVIRSYGDIEVSITQDIGRADFRICMEWEVDMATMYEASASSHVAAVLAPIERVLIAKSRAQIEAGELPIVLGED
jgi:hypothetical protein